MRGEIDRDAIPQLVQYDRKHLPGELSIGTERLRNLVEPAIRGLKCLVEDVQTCRAHVASVFSRHRGSSTLPLREGARRRHYKRTLSASAFRSRSASRS